MTTTCSESDETSVYVARRRVGTLKTEEKVRTTELAAKDEKSPGQHTIITKELLPDILSYS